MDMAWRVQQIRAMIKEAANEREVVLLAVTKNRSPQEVNALVENGLFAFGENRVQEWSQKREFLHPKLAFHFIGRLQSNKVKYIINEVELIHSVDRLSLAREIDKQARLAGRKVDVLLQVNIAGEIQKGGVLPAQLEGLYREIMQMDCIRVRGLMTVAPNDGAENVRWVFKRAKELFDQMRQENPAIELLSMGMSQDMQVALEEGANIIRVGSALFDDRYWEDTH